MHALHHGRERRTGLAGVVGLAGPSGSAARATRLLHAHPVLLTVLAALGALTGLGIAAFMTRDPREAGAYAVACVMIGGAMALGQRPRAEHEAAATAHDTTPATDARDAEVATEDELRAELHAVAHDLRGPLLTVTSYLDLIAQGTFGPVSDEARVALSRCAAVAGRAQDVVDSSLRPRSLVASGAAGGPVAARAVDLRRLWVDVLAALDASVHEHGAQVTLAPNLPHVRGDEAALFRVFENLLQNSLKYARLGVSPQVAVAWRRLHGGAVELSVHDNGAGIRPHERTRVLAAGVRGSSALDGPQGVEGQGLGLATATRLVARMGGTLTIDARDGEHGAVVRVTLPGC